ncbi:MAG: L,D-transpeptidase [Chitinophagaceae bacterium]
MATFKFIKTTSFPAYGGPANKGTGADGFETGPTRPGRFVIHSISKFSSQRYKDWSGIKWNTPLRVHNGAVQINTNGIWINLSKADPSSHWYYNGENKTYEQQIIDIIQARYKDLYGISKVPDKWVFNDFGHATIQYFKDLNNNYLLDGKEFVMGDMIHTTPDNEAATTLQKPFKLVASHGCVHVRPNDMDQLIASGFVKKGQVIEIHPYTEITYQLNFQSSLGKPPFELHFFPGCVFNEPGSPYNGNNGTIIIYSVTAL